MNLSPCSIHRSKASKLRVEPSFYVFWAIFSLLDSESVLPVFACAAIIHETGHLLMIHLCGGYTACVRLSACGVVIEQTRSLARWKNICISLSGPLAGLIAAVICSLQRHPMAAGANVLLSGFNLLPIVPLDGGCILYNLLERFDCAQMVYWVSFLTAAMLTAFGGVFLCLTGRNATLLIIGICLLGNTAYLLRTNVNYGMMVSDHIKRL